MKDSCFFLFETSSQHLFDSGFARWYSPFEESGVAVSVTVWSLAGFLGLLICFFAPWDASVARDPSYFDSGIRMGSLGRRQGLMNAVDELGSWSGLSGHVH